MQQIPGLYMLDSEERGRGMYCINDISEGDLIEVCPVLIIPKCELPIIHKTTLHDYYFLWGEDMDQCVIALGYGSIYNHEVECNADFHLDMPNKTIDIIAISDIPAHTEITLNYHGEYGDETELWFEVR